MSSYKKWLVKRLAELEAGAEVVETSKGLVEYERRGSAPYVLFFHAGNGGYDQSFLNDHLVAASFGCISLSRPGYLRTPLATGRRFAEQADAAAALLDVLGIDRVAVHGASMGGPAAIQFAARHAGRTAALLLTSAISTVYPYFFPSWGRFMTGSNFASWLTLRFAERFPKIAIQETLKLASTDSKDERRRVVARTMNTPEWLKILYQITYSTTPAAPRKDGFYNDLEQCERIKSKPLPLDQIRCPTLIVHGAADGDVQFTHAETAHRLIPNAELYRMEGAYHIVWLSDLAPEMRRAQIEFLKKHLT